MCCGGCKNTANLWRRRFLKAMAVWEEDIVEMMNPFS